MKMYHRTIEHVRLRPGMYCNLPGNSQSIFEMTLRYFVDSHIAGCSNRLCIDYKGTHICLRDFGIPIPLDKMESGENDSLHRWNGDFYGLSGWESDEKLVVLMGLSQEMELTTFQKGKQLTVRSIEDGRCGKISSTTSGDGIEIYLTCKDNFDPAYIFAIVQQFHALYPEYEMFLNGQPLLESNGLIDLLHQKLNPTRILEPLCSSRGEELDFTAARQLYPKIDGGPFIFSYMNCHETYDGGEHNDAVMRVLRKIALPCCLNDLCIIFHCKQKKTLNPTFCFTATSKSQVSFSTSFPKSAFEKRIVDIFKDCQ